MKKALLLAVMLVLLWSTPALAFGIGPAEVEFDVPADGSITQTFTVYDLTGDLQISLEDIPLKVEPTTVSVAVGNEGTKIELTFYGDESLGSREYNGYVRFLAVTEGNVGMGIKVRAKVTNIVEGQPVLEVPVEQPLPPEAAPEEPSSPEAAPELMPPESSPTPTPPQPQATEQKGVEDDLSLNLVILIAGGLVFLGLVVLAISLIVRRRH